ncbi:RIMS-binding protein 2-like [Pogona vitticeps]
MSIGSGKVWQLECKIEMENAGAPRPPPRKAPSQPVGPGVAAGHSHASAGGCPPPSSPFHEDHRRELEALRSELEAERLRSQEARRRFALEARELRQAAERDRQLLADQLRSKWEQQRARELRQLREASLRQREVEIRQLLRWKEAELREAQELLQRERDAAMRQARDLQRQLAEELVGRGSKGTGVCVAAGGGSGAAVSTESRAKLQEVLGKLRWEVDGEQAARIRHLKAELELERSLFLKYILERFEGEHALQRYRPASFQQQLPQPPAKLEKTRPRSLESLVPARDSPPAEPASKSRSLYNNLSLSQSSHHHHRYDFLDGQIPKDSSHCLLQPQKMLGDAFQRDTLEPVPKTDETVDIPLEGKGSSWGPVEGAPIAAGQQPESQGWLAAGSFDQLVKQNEALLKVLAELEQQCTLLREENTLLRKSNFPKMEEKVKKLKKKNTELIGIARRLEERAKTLQESSLKVGNTPVTLSLSCQDMDLYKTSLAWQQAEELSAQAGEALGKGQHLPSQRERWELQTKRATGMKSPCLFKIIDFDCLLRESQREVLRLQRQLMLKNQKKSPQHSKISSNDAASSVMIKNTSSNLVSCLEDSSLPKKTAKALNTSVEDVESKAFSAKNGSKNNENSTFETDSDTEHQLQILKEKLSEKVRDYETLKHEVEKNRKKYHDLELQLNETLTEKIRIAEQNFQLHKKNECREKTENENEEIKVKLTIDDHNSVIQLARELEIKVENLEQVIRDMKETVGKQQQLESEHKETLLVLQKREEEIKQMQQIQTEIKRDYKKAVQLLEAQVKKSENNCQSQTEQFYFLESVQLQIKKSELIESKLPYTICSSTAVLSPEKWEENNCHILHCSENINFKDAASINSSGLFGKAKELESHSNSSEKESVQNSSKSCSNPEKDTAGELGEMETDNVSINLMLKNQCSSKLRVFLARHSYDPFDGPNKNPKAELPLTAGEYVYVYGEMDEDGFYEGELMDGRRGMVPSNLIEEVSDNDLISFVPTEPSEISSHSYNEMGFPCHSTSSEENSDGAEALCADVLTSGLRRELYGDQTAVPCPQNLTLIKQFARSILIGWDPPHIQDNWEKVHSYNIYVNTDLYNNVKPSSHMKALIENLDLESYTYQISVQSLTDKGNSDKMQCTFLVGKSFSAAPEFLRLRSLTATLAEITWLPSNSNYTHAVYLNGEKYDETNTGTYWYTFQNLKPNSQYNVEVEAHPPNDVPFQGNLKKKSTAITFTTPSAGPPNPPLDVQVQPSSVGYLAIHWLPATIDSAGSSNGVKVTGYSVYVNGQKVTEIMSPTAGSVSLSVSHLLIFQESWKVSVRTMSAFGESEDSVPALIPPHLVSISGSLLAKSVACTMAPDLTFKESLECKATTMNTSSSICTHVFHGDTIHFTSECKESTDLPAVTASWNHMFPSVMASHNARNENGGDSRLHLSAWKKSSEHAFPEATCGGSASSIQVASKSSCIKKVAKTFAKDMQREECFLSKNIACKNQSNNSKIKVNTVSQYTNMIVEDNSLQYHVEDLDANHLSHEPNISSPEFLLNKSSYRNMTTHNAHLWKECDGFFGDNHIKQLCKKLSNLSLCNNEPEEMQVSRTVRHDPLGAHNHTSDLLDTEEEEEYIMSTSGKDDFTPQKQQISLSEETNDKVISMMLKSQQATPSVPHSGSQIGFDSGDKDSSERLFVALFDYDPVTVPHNTKQAREELSFKVGQILKVTSDKDAHGFYKGECEGKKGYIPCNTVSEMYIESKEVRDHLLKKSFMQDETL